MNDMWIIVHVSISYILKFNYDHTMNNIAIAICYESFRFIYSYKNEIIYNKCINQRRYLYEIYIKKE